MALISCEECGKQISDKAQHCVHCGAPIEKVSDAPINKPSSTQAEELDDSVKQFLARNSEENNSSSRKKVDTQQALTMPNGVWWFERLMTASVAIGLLSLNFVKMPSSDKSFGLGVAVITLLFVFWASRGRSNFAKWLNGISVALGTIMVIPVIQTASMYGNPLVGNPVTGSQGGLLLVQTLMQITAIALLFGNDSKKWFEKQGQ